MHSLLEIISYLLGGLIILVFAVAVGINYLLSDMDEDGNFLEEP
ncbi:hypothetical protein [Vreelandella alkaliphila]